ncbi:MAG: hypothetical protein Q9159_005958 [Coniocarpon cinnabarinum]
MSSTLRVESCIVGRLSGRLTYSRITTFSGITSRSASAMAESQIPKAEYRQLGKSGLRVSVPILGAMSLGDKRWQPWVVEEAEALPILKAAFDQGLNSWDTANVYSNGESERIIAKAIKKYTLPRHKLVLMTKCNGLVRQNNEPDTLAIPNPNEQADYINQRGLSRAAIFNAVNASLQRLETDYIDLLQIHRFDSTTPIAETMKALHDLVESGKVRYIGASSMWTYQFCQMQFTAEKNGWTSFISMQNCYSLLYREEVTKKGETTRASDPFISKITTQDELIISRVEELAKKHGWPMSHVALAWINRKVSSPIIGFSNIERLNEALAARGKALTDEEEQYLMEPYRPLQVIGHS